MKNRRFLVSLLIAILVMAMALPAFADVAKPDNFPTKPVRCIIPYAAGGNSDMNARKLAEIIEKYDLMPQKMIVTNMQGSNTMEAFNALMGADPDGHTILLQHTAILTQPAFGNVTYTMEDVAAVCEVLEQPFFIYALADAPFNNTAELIEYVKNNPDEPVTFGIPGIASSGQMGSEVYLDQTGLRDNMLFIYYGSGGLSLTAQLGGECMLRGGFATDGMRYVPTGELKVIAVSGDERLDILPDVECFAELGFETNYMTRQGMWTTKGTPDDVIAYLADVFAKACDTDEYREYLATSGCSEAYAGPQEWHDLMAGDYEVVQNLVDTLGLAVNK